MHWLLFYFYYFYVYRSYIFTIFITLVCYIYIYIYKFWKVLFDFDYVLIQIHYLDSLIKKGFQKLLSVPQKGLRKPKKPSNENILLFVIIFNRNRLNNSNIIKSSVNCLKNNSVSGFHNIKLIQSNRQYPSLKKILKKEEFGKVLLGTFNCSDKRCESCNYPLMNNHYTFLNVQITFKLKKRFPCDTFNLIYDVICDTC